MLYKLSKIFHVHDFCLSLCNTTMFIWNMDTSTIPDDMQLSIALYDRCCSHTGRVGSGGQKLYVSEICINANESLAEIFHRLVNKDHCSEGKVGTSWHICNCIL